MLGNEPILAVTEVDAQYNLTAIAVWDGQVVRESFLGSLRARLGAAIDGFAGKR